MTHPIPEGPSLAVEGKREGPQPRKKPAYIGAPAHFALEAACRQVCDAFADGGLYLVGSALERADWRDIDVRLMLDDEDFIKLFPDVNMKAHAWEFDARWLLLTVSISEHLSRVTGLPIDFQFQPRTHANERHKGRRHALGMRVARESYGERERDRTPDQAVG
jgi:hypothetical protein